MYGESQFYTPYEQDVPYGMSHNMPQENVPYGMSQNYPQPMGNMPSMQQGYPSMGLPFSNNNQMPQGFAKGGRVNHPLYKAMNQIRQMGEGDDQILAHINPEEARELSARHGSDINPVTGLPQFGKFSRMFKKALPMLVRTAATAIGTMVGGPAGGTTAAALASAVMEKSRGGKFGKGLVKGAIHGATQAYGLPMVGNAMGVSPTGPTGTFMGMNKPMVGNLGTAIMNAGKSGLGGINSREAAFEALKKVGQPQSSGMDGLFNSGNINKALMASSIIGTLGAKYKTPKEPSLQDAINNGPKWGPEHQPRKLHGMDRNLRHFDPNNYTPGFSPEMLYYDEVNPVGHYADGGHVQTFGGQDSGQADTLPVHLQEGDYIVDSSTVSDLGDGSTQAGAGQLQNLVNGAMQGHNYKKGGLAKTVPAMVSPTEVRISKDAVDAIGKGNNTKGASILKNMVKNVRKHKRSSSKGLPPKAKNIKSYLGSK